MGLSIFKLLVILVLLYILLATPWYIPKVVKPLVFGIPLWVVLTVTIILILGYVLVYAVALSIERRVEHG
jgi:MFS superfamily sulfate permease-like transporter